MSTPEQLEASLRARERRVARWQDRWLRGPTTPVDVALGLAWAGAIAARWTLTNVRADGGWAWMIGLSIAGALVAVTRSRLGWALSALMLTGPLFLLQDWLTQTLVMLLIALVGAATARAPVHDGDDAGRPVRDTARWVTALTYLIAAFHKLNEGFLSPQTGCAAAGWDELNELFPTLPLALPDALRGALAHATLGVEVALFGLLLVRPRVAILLGLLFHVPLTWAFAPAFVFVMLIGYVAALTSDDVVRLARRLHEHRRAWLTLAAASGALFIALSDTTWVRSDLWVKTPILAVLIALVALDLLRSPAVARATARPGRAAAAAAVFFVVNAAGPYLGTQMQHTGAMLSNLRVDDACWNHLLVPPSASLGDPYIRIDHASFAGERALSEQHAQLVTVLETRLWNGTQLHQMRRNWCSERVRPFRLEGTHLGAAFVVEDVCAPNAALPRDRGVFGGRAWFPNYLRWQKNLPRACPMRCIH